MIQKLTVTARKYTSGTDFFRSSPLLVSSGSSTLAGEEGTNADFRGLRFRCGLGFRAGCLPAGQRTGAAVGSSAGRAKGMGRPRNRNARSAAGKSGWLTEARLFGLLL